MFAIHNNQIETVIKKQLLGLIQSSHWLCWEENLNSAFRPSKVQMSNLYVLCKAMTLGIRKSHPTCTLKIQWLSSIKGSK